VLTKRTKGSLIADGWIQEKPFREIIDTGVSVTIARPDTVAGLPETELSRPYVLQTASGATTPVVEEERVELTLGLRTLRIWVFVTYITDDFFLGLDILQAYNASVDVGRHVLRLGHDEVPVREPSTASVLKRSRPIESRRNSQPVCWQCSVIGHLRRELTPGNCQECP
jgi:hypothetical protein